MKVYYTHNFTQTRKSRNYRLNGVVGRSPSKAKSSTFGLSQAFWKNLSQWVQPDDSFKFQVFGMLILTVAVILTFQNFLSATNVSTSANQSNTNSEVRILTNFQQDIYSTPGSPTQLREIPVAPVNNPSVVPVDAGTEAKLQEQAEEKKQSRTTYVIVEGDTLGAIALKFKVTPQELIQLNNIQDPATIRVGQQIQIP